MKIMKKVLSIVMVVTMLSTVFLIPSQAVAPGSTADFKLSIEKDATVRDTNGATSDKVYKVTMSGKASLGIVAMILGFTYNSEHFTPVSMYEGTFDWNYPCNDTNGIDVAHTLLGDFAMNKQYDAQGNETTGRAVYKDIGLVLTNDSNFKLKMIGPKHAAYQAYVPGYSETEKAKLSAVMLSWNAVNKSASYFATTGYEDMLSMYFILNPGVTESMVQGDVFCMTRSKKPDTTLETNPIHERFYLNTQSKMDTCEKMTVADVTIAPPVVAGPAVASHKSEIRFNGVKPTPTSFDYRITSKILQADWDKYFAGTKAGAATNAITKVGAVAFDPVKGGTFDLAQAKTVAKAGASSGSYGYGSTTYIQKTATDAFFGCIIPGLTHTANNQDMQVLGFVEYKDATGAIQYIFYDAAATAAVNSKYDTALALWSK